MDGRWLPCVAGFGLHSYVAFSDDSECGEKVGEDQEVANLLAEIAQFKRAAFRLCADVETYERAETHRVHVGEIGEVEDDALVGAEDLRDGKIQEICVSSHEFAVTADDGGIAFSLDLEGEGFGCSGFSHA